MWGVGVAAAGAMFSSWNWGRGNGYVNVNVNRAVNIDNHFDRNRYTNNNHWQHDAVHRRGVAYHDPATRQQFGQHRPGVEQRQQFRGQVASRPQAGGAHPNLPQRPAGQQCPMVQNRGSFAGGDRPSAPSGINRGQQVNREAARGRVQQNRAAGHPSVQRAGGSGVRGGRR